MDLREQLIKFFTDAARDEPSRKSVQIIDGFWTLTLKGNRDKWANTVQTACVPPHAEQTIDSDTLTVRWHSIADQIFGETGLIAQRLPGYEMRRPQLHMARLVQRSIEMGEPAIIEAGTGVGKSYAYAAVAMAMNKRVVISTSNKALQAQLFQKDIPFLCKLFPGKKVALAQGKSNYLCRAKCQDENPALIRAQQELSAAQCQVDKLWQEWRDNGEQGDGEWYESMQSAEQRLTLARTDARLVAARVGIKIDNHTLAEWYKTTESGNTEELEFHVSFLNQWTIDDECTGRRCPFYASCFYYKAKAERQGADVIICNHALLILDRLYPQANILPGCDVVVVDEAHKLAEYARGALGQEFTIDGIRRSLDTAYQMLYGGATATAEGILQEYYTDIAAYCVGGDKRQVGIKHEDQFEAGQRLAAEMHVLADQIWNPEDTPEDDDGLKRSKRADKMRDLADRINAASSPTAEGWVRWIEPETNKVINLPFNVANFIGRMAGFTTETPPVIDRHLCARCGRGLTAAVHVLDGVGYGPDCIRHVDLFGDAEVMPLAQWSASDAEPIVKHNPTAIIFTSATIAAPTLDHFMRECGLSHGFMMIAGSPFDYASNALLYVPNGETPTPKAADAWQAYMIGDVRSLVNMAGGGAFLLFTSYANMKYALSALRGTFESNGLKVLVQGELPKGQIIKEFKANGNAVLFATKSFWEGVSIEGAALRLVMIDKMPFAAPSPLLKAREAAVGSNAFGEISLPEMIIDLKQGAGRLIRRMDDCGVIALLDSRARLTGYGREKVLPSLPPAKLVHDIYQVGAFFEQRKAIEPPPPLDFPVQIDPDVWDELDELGF